MLKWEFIGMEVKESILYQRFESIVQNLIF